MDEKPPERMDAQLCHAKAQECRGLAKLASRQGDRTMLLHMAETWERIAKTCDNGR
jgi:hypothetical protein